MQISRLTNLRVLDIGSNPIRDEGLEYLGRLTNLVDLKLCKSRPI